VELCLGLGIEPGNSRYQLRRSRILADIYMVYMNGYMLGKKQLRCSPTLQYCRYHSRLTELRDDLYHTIRRLPHHRGHRGASRIGTQSSLGAALCLADLNPVLTASSVRL
jgi:hypothetical protein